MVTQDEGTASDRDGKRNGASFKIHFFYNWKILKRMGKTLPWLRREWAGHCHPDSKVSRTLWPCSIWEVRCALPQVCMPASSPGNVALQNLQKYEIVDTFISSELSLLPMSTSATKPMVTPKKLTRFCPSPNSTSIKSSETVLFSEAPWATLHPDQAAPKLLVPSKGWLSWRKSEQLRALPEPPGTIPTGKSHISSQSGRCQRPLYTSWTSPSPDMVMIPE